MKIEKIDLEEMRAGIRGLPLKTRREWFRNLQVVVFVMCGGGVLGLSAAQSPGHFMIDDRASPPYPRKAIEQAAAVLFLLASSLGYDPGDCPEIGLFPNCGVF